MVGLYRLCGSAAVKKELREAFERDSHAVELSENNYPDINVITGTASEHLCLFLEHSAFFQLSSVCNVDGDQPEVRGQHKDSIYSDLYRDES